LHQLKFQLFLQLNFFRIHAIDSHETKNPILG
jgi:hypothetical protein